MITQESVNMRLDKLLAQMNILRRGIQQDPGSQELRSAFTVALIEVLLALNATEFLKQDEQRKEHIRQQVSDDMSAIRAIWTAQEREATTH